MIGSAVNYLFRAYLPKNFCTDDIRNKYNEVIQHSFQIPYEDVVDYLNASCKSATVPGLKDDGSETQNSQGSNRTFAGSVLLPLQNVDKRVIITYELKDSFFNWMIFFEQILYWIDWSKGGKFLPNIYLQIMDMDENIIAELIYKGVQFQNISNLDLATSNAGLGSKEFDIEFRWNDFEFKIHYDKMINPRT